MKKLVRSIKQAIWLFFILILTNVFPVFSQSAADLRINELLVQNDSNYVDDYGQRSGWIEIFNSAYNTVNLGGMYLTNDRKNPTKYIIPSGDPITQIPPRNYLVFFADNHTTRGILHLNFDLEETNYFAIYDASGKEIIDEITFEPQPSDISYGRLTDGGKQWGVLDKTTPKANNYTGKVVTAGENFVKMDPYGIGMAMIAISVVFLALILLYLVFKNTKRFYDIKWANLFKKKDDLADIQIEMTEEISGEVNGAIAMALFLYTSELHDNEQTVLTIKKVARTYSPWSSKIYGMRNYSR